VNRRAFIMALGGATTSCSRVACAQQPAIGFLHAGVAAPYAHILATFRQGMKETGFVEGQNVAIEQRWAENQDDRLPELAADLVRRQVAVILSGGASSALAAKAATSTIPIVLAFGGDPVQLGLVASLNRPGGNVTGVTVQTVEATKKRLDLLCDLTPQATIVVRAIRSGSRDAARHACSGSRHRAAACCRRS
jgi:putative ABC transport system substrate-binding protein